MLFRRNPPRGDTPTPEALAQRIDQLAALDGALRSAVRSLLVLLKGFSLDLEELKSSDFRQQIDEMGELVATADGAPALDKSLKKTVPEFQAYVNRQSAYLVEREAELRNVIQLLSNAMTLLNRENASYHQQILDQGHNFERIIGLDDLRKIKESLAREVQQLTTMVETKRRAEQNHFAKLSGEVKELREELKKSQNEGRRDALTGVYNRRALDEYLQSLVDLYQIRRNTFAVLIFDIDNFKLVNDRHGHLVGDQVIQAMAGACLQVLRDEDFVARYGGEEFVAVMPGATRRIAERRAENLRKAVAGTRFALPAGSRESYLQVTISAGVSEYRVGETAKGLLERADQALYLAKQGGKNRVATH